MALADHSNKARYITWPIMLYIFAFALPMRNLNGIYTASDALLASGIIGLPSFLIAFPLVAVINIFRKQKTKTWVPNLHSKRGALFVTCLIFVLTMKALVPDGIAPLVFAFAAMALVAGKWRDALPTDGVSISYQGKRGWRYSFSYLTGSQLNKRNSLQVIFGSLAVVAIFWFARDATEHYAYEWFGYDAQEFVEDRWPIVIGVLAALLGGYRYMSNEIRPPDAALNKSPQP